MILEILINSSKTNFYIVMKEPDKYQDLDIAKLLDISLEEYQKILLSHNAFPVSSSFNGSNCDFYTKEDAEAALKELEPYLIMQNLVGEL